MKVTSRFFVIAGLLASGCSARSSNRTVLTFNKDIAPIVFEHCSGCHRPGQLAPFSLLSYEDVRKHTQQIVAMTKSSRMPPWLPEAGYGEFANERRLKREEIDRIEQWVKQGAVAGDPSDRLPTPKWSEGWQLGQPDLILELPQPYQIHPGGADVFRNFVIRAPVSTTRYVRAVEFHPGNPKVVHHAVMAVDSTSSSRRLDDEDPEPGYDGMLWEGARAPDGHFIGWTPGKVPFMEQPGNSWRLDRGADLVVQLHLLPSEKPDLVQPRLGLFFTDTPPARAPFLIKLGSKTIDIPAGKADYTIADTYVLPVDVDAQSVYPHAHFLAKEMKAFATLPDGTTKWLIWIRNWDFHWQDAYRYAAPIFLPKGTVVTMQYTYDNSAGNPENPHHPPTRVTFGPHSSDEMGDLWLQVLPRNSADVDALWQDFEKRELVSDTARGEMMVAVTPGDAAMRNFLAIQYVKVGRVQDAIVQLEEALRLKPSYSEALNNLGNLLLVRGQPAQAIGYFREVLKSHPDDFRAHYNLGIALRSIGQVDDAIRQFRRTIALNPDFADVHDVLGMALGSQGKIEEAIRQFEQALVINPRHADAHNNLGFALAGQGKVDQAMLHFRRALEIRPDHADARENLRLLQKSTTRSSAP